MGIKLAVVSDAPSREAWMRLYYLNLHHVFDPVLTYDDTKETGHNIMIFVISITSLKALSKLMSQLKKNINVLNVIRKQS